MIGPNNNTGENVDSAVTQSMGAFFAYLGSMQGEDILIFVSVIVMVGRGIYDLIRFCHYMGDRKREQRQREQHK